MRGATAWSSSVSKPPLEFQSTRPMRGATSQSRTVRIRYRFQSTRPMRGATSCACGWVDLPTGFQSTRPMRGATISTIANALGIAISIHAPHAGRDCTLMREIQTENISIHAPHAGRDLSFPKCTSTLYISIHAPHAGRDAPTACKIGQADYFNPRASCGARPKRRSKKYANQHFNPRAPCGARLTFLVRLMANLTFQSTRPMRGATAFRRLSASDLFISIHAPHAGRDFGDCCFSLRRMDFNPRAPCGARRDCPRSSHLHQHFNPRAPCGARRLHQFAGLRY